LGSSTGPRVTPDRGRRARRITFRRLGKRDLPLLHRWLNTPHVLEWWDRPGPTLDQVRAKYLPRLVRPAGGFAAYIIHSGERPVGYIQVYRVQDGTWKVPESELVREGMGVDLFIGDPRYLYRGLGPRILRRFLTAIVFRNPGVHACFIDPSPRNRVAIRAFEKAGFRRVGNALAPKSVADVCLMRLTREELGQKDAD
jgi:RimJ/RimL family protein N-acetyltransferase